MKYSSYLTFKSHIYRWIILFILWILSPLSFFVLFVLYYGVELFLYRKYVNRYVENASDVNIYSILDGKVLDVIEHNSSYEIKFNNNLLDEGGLYLPFSCEIMDVHINIAKRKSEYTISLNKDIKIILFYPLNSILNSMKNLYVSQGDKGKAKARIGHFIPYFQTSLYLPKNYEILVESNQKVKSADTLIAKRV